MRSTQQEVPTSHTRDARRWSGAVLVLAVAALLYLYRYGDPPMHLGGDESHFAVQAQALATTGKDLNGRTLPLFVNLQGPTGPSQSSTRWYQPALFYLMAATLSVLPLDEASVRLPLILVGVLNVGLVYVVASMLFTGRGYPALAAAFLLFTPAHLIFSRQAADYLLPIPIVLGWLALLVRSLMTGHVGTSLAGGVLLGCGLFSYLAAWAIMPALLAFGLVAGLVSGHRRVAFLLAPVAGFAIPAMALVTWLVAHPAMLQETVSRYSAPGTQHLNALQRIREFLNYDNVQEIAAVYWDYFNPTFLFLTGGSNLTTSTRRVGLFLWPLAPFVICGLYDVSRRARREPMALVLLAGFLLAPVPASLVGERYAAQRALLLMPFGVLIAAHGAAWLARRPSRLARAVVIVLLAAMPISFTAFYRDYFDGHRLRSAFWFDPVNFRGVASRLLATDASVPWPAVYFAEDLDDVGARWNFYLMKANRQDLWARTRFYNPRAFDGATAPSGALLVTYASDPFPPALVAGGQWEVVDVIADANGSAAAQILRKR
jgi:4-amino-4-deoxy-L-arabinose transferase-like glycosyltransferase